MSDAPQSVSTGMAEALELADLIERSEGLIRMVPGQGTVQLGIKRTAVVIAALRAYTDDAEFHTSVAKTINERDDLRAEVEASLMSPAYRNTHKSRRADMRQIFSDGDNTHRFPYRGDK